MAGFDRSARITGRTELKARLVRSDNTPIYNKTVAFMVDGVHVIDRPTTVSGYAAYPYYTVPDGAGAGVRTITASWAGDIGYRASTKDARLTVSPAIAYIWVLPKSALQGATVGLYAYFRRLYDYAKQTGKPVTFSVDGTDVQTVVTDAAGVARHTYSTTEPVGDHTIRCRFAGDAWVDAGYGEGRLRIY